MSYSFSHKHLLGIQDLSTDDISAILDRATGYAERNRSNNRSTSLLAGKTVVNLFFENSTRTRASFEIAAKRLGADTINIPLNESSIKKGETLLDTILTLDAMQIDALVIRHSQEYTPHSITPHVQAHVINAGDGKHEHPTQALLDALTILRHKKSLSGLVIAICGDVAHSRVARSNIHLLKKFGAEIRVVAPEYFLSPDYKDLDIDIFDNMTAGLANADVVMVLRVQRERTEPALNSPLMAQEYAAAYCLTHDKLAAAKPDAIVMHPAPINRGVEITNELADDTSRSVIREQVEMGVAVRMAVMELLLSPPNSRPKRWKYCLKIPGL